MRTPIFQIDAFTNRRFAGNPAAVMPMDSFPADAVLQAIAAENNLAEAAFLVPNSGDYHLRWFTPTTEVPLCGHATLASADFISRYFAPAIGVPEDPVTGSVHCMLTPYWAKRLNKTEFRAFQASRRGGEIICRLVGDRVELQGTVVFYLEGQAEI